jgi:hypothetical protein
MGRKNKNARTYGIRQQHRLAIQEDQERGARFAVVHAGRATAGSDYHNVDRVLLSHDGGAPGGSDAMVVRDVGYRCWASSIKETTFKKPPSQKKPV